MPHRDTRALVAHLFRRAGFGLRPEELDRFTSLGIRGSVEYLLNYDALPDPSETRFPAPDLGPLTGKLNQLFAELDQSRPDRAELTRQLRAALDQAKLLLQSWWINRMLHTSRPLQEKMTLFWHGHFATALQKVDAAQMLPQNLLFRRMALGNFGTLLAAVTRDPAMLHWLDGDLSRKGHPNENYAREVMELFTLGVGHYTEHDVREGARALTGWVLELFTYKPRWVPRYHDDGIKSYLGHSGAFGPDEVMAILAAHPRTGVFLGRKLFEFFAHDNADAATVREIADTYYRSGHDIKAVVRQILLSDAFYSEASFQQHFRSPAEFVIGTTRELGSVVSVSAMARSMTVMGQDLFNPPNVGGWPGGFTWSTAGALAERFNFAGLLVGRQDAGASSLDTGQLLRRSGARTAAGLVDYLLGRFIGLGATEATRSALLEYLGGSQVLASPLMDMRVRGLLQLVLTAPEYQLN